MDQMKNEQIVVVVWMEQLQGTHKGARNDGPLPNYINEVLVMYLDVLMNKLS